MSYRPGFQDYTGRSMPHVARVEIAPLDGSPFILDVAGGTVTMDHSQLPSVTASIVCPVPEDVARASGLDARRRTRARIMAGYVPDTTEDVDLLADLMVDEKAEDEADGTITLTLACDEAYGQDVKKLAGDGEPPLTGAVEALSWIIRKVMAPERPTIVTTVAAGFQPAGLEGMETESGTEWAGVLADVCSRTETAARCRPDRTWEITIPRTVSDTPVLYLEDGPRAAENGRAGTIKTAGMKTGRTDGFANHCTVSHRWEKPEGTYHTINGTAGLTDGPSAIATIGPVMDHIVRETAATKAQADKAAASRLRVLARRGYSLDVTAVAAYWLRPGDTVEVATRRVPRSRWLVETVQFELGAGSMNLSLRQPDNSTIEMGI